MKKQITLKIIFLAIIIGVTVSIFVINFQQVPIQVENISNNNIPRAAIIDQLHKDIPNQNYQGNVTEYLQKAGYEVDLYTTDDITVDFYKKLPSMNYKFIVVRSHSLGVGTIEKSASLFTGELYRQDRYMDEQYSGIVGSGVPYLPEEVENLGGLETLTDETYFVVGSRLVDELMIGTFPQSIIVLGGCETTEGTFLVDSLLRRGASAVIGWDGLVTSADNDEVIMQVLNETLVNDVDINKAVKSVMKEFDQKLSTPAKLVYYSTGATTTNG